jgi:hypothetical protein
MAPLRFTVMPSRVYMVVKLKWSAGVKDDDDDDDNNNNNNGG